MAANAPLYFVDRLDWRAWLLAHFETEAEAWLVYPKKSSGKPRMSYNDAVEEALCVGWIDSINKTLDDQHSMQRFTPRKARAAYSQANKERLRWLYDQGMIHLSMQEAVAAILAEPFTFPEDILQAIHADAAAWAFYQQCSAPYRRIRIAYIEQARKRPDEFQKRLRNFMEKCGNQQLIKGYGGIDKYY